MTFHKCLKYLRLNFIRSPVLDYICEKGMKGLGNFGKIAVGWGLITFGGIYAFVLSKNSIDKKRIESMQIRDRMKKSNIGEYERSERRFN